MKTHKSESQSSYNKIFEIKCTFKAKEVGFNGGPAETSMLVLDKARHSNVKEQIFTINFM